MKISKILTALAVAAAVSGFASCSNSSDTPVVPPAVLGPSVKITGSNVIAAAATSLLNESTRTILYAFPSNFGSDTIKFTWSVVEGKEHVENPTNVYAESLEVYAKDGDTSVESADQTFKVKVLVQSATNASKKAEAEYTVTILKKTTDEAGRVPLKFIEWKPDFSYVPDNDVATSDRTYKPATGETAAVNPGNNAYFVTPTPIYNGYSANQSSGAFRKGWIFTTSDTTVAAIVDSAGATKSEATYTDANGTGAKALIVNKTEKESVDLTVAGEYKLSDDVKPTFTKKVTRKVAKGRKITVKLLKGIATTLNYKGSYVTSTGIVLDDVYAGVDYVTEAIEGGYEDGGIYQPDAPAKGLINNAAGALATTATAYYGKVTFRVKYDAADNSEFDVKWTN
ncbi:MAG: hypothetical protein IKN82_10150 [Treponema sp.]|nr:hypothetical protein [Treponema sp.]